MFKNKSFFYGLIFQILLVFNSNGANAELSKIEVYLSNLNGQIEGLKYKIQQEPDSYLSLIMLSQLWYEKSGYSGNPYDTLKAIDLITNALSQIQKSNSLEQKLERANLYLIRARQQMRIHKFDQAKSDLNQARLLGAPKKKVLDLIIDIDWNLGHYDRALKLAQEALVLNPNRINLIHLAGLEHELGKLDQANSHYQSAKLMTNDGVYLNPVQLAWLDVQIGINFFKMQDYPKSEMAFQSAIAIAPNFNMALEHLAETLVYVNRINEAITLYEKIIKQSDDPEFMGQLAKLYRHQNRVDAADKLALIAKVKFLHLLKDFPEAMYWHAASFFLEEGKDPQLALHFLELNAKLRPNSNSLLALTKVQISLDLKTQAKKSMLNILKMAPTSSEICELAKKLIKKTNMLFIRKCKIKSSF